MILHGTELLLSQQNDPGGSLREAYYKWLWSAITTDHVPRLPDLVIRMSMISSVDRDDSGTVIMRYRRNG